MARDAQGYALHLLNRFAGSDWADKLGLRKPVEKSAYTLTRTGFRLVATAARKFSGPRQDRPTRLNKPGHVTDLFDLNVTDEQQMIRESVQSFARDVLRPAAHEADEKLEMSDSLVAQAHELGLTMFAVPENFGGAAAERSPVTSALVAEDLAHGDMALALGILCPISVANALTQWGSADQQSKYLTAFCSEKPPVATIAVNEPVPLFNPHRLVLTASKAAGGWVLNGVKSGVPLAHRSELLLVAAQTADGPAVFIVEGGTKGVSYTDGRSMGLRAAGLCDIAFDNVALPADAKLGDGEFSYKQFIDYGSMAWSALAVGTGQAVLDYVIPYVNERVAFGEPIAHRQSVAFMVANIGIELEAMRLVAWRAASRAEQGLDFHREAFLARTIAGERGMEIGTNGVQLLGGHGFTKEHPVERWYRDLRAVGIQYNGLHL
ncbi:MAG: acyl-CoA dehydrogenase family protein [Pseudomonadota bacterium]